ncbi:MAG: ATP-dependent DNA helicase [Steroidobacteraceae bacterium]
MQPLHDIFAADGPLQRALPQFTLRRDQLRMAERVWRALEARETLVAEAGTGIGKTFAYLVPALLCGLRVLVSTGTRALQDQLYSKDLPLVSGALGRPARVALLKGRANYLCRYRLERALTARTLLETSREEPWLARIERWAETTRTGDLAEVPGLPDAHPLRLEVTSTRENCLGTACAELGRCHVAAARRQAQDSDIVIVNHHLLLADLMLKEDGFGDLLGSADALILDEAHQLPDLAAQFFGASGGTRRIDSLLDAVRQALPAIDAAAAATAAIRAAAAAVEDSVREVARALPPRSGRHAWEECGASLGRSTGELAEALEGLCAELASAGARDPADARGTADDSVAAGESVWSALGVRAGEVASQIARIAAVDELEGARSVEVTARGFTLHFLPFEIAERFRALIEARSCAWIFTSATLSIGEDFEHFTARLGLSELAASPLKIESPFDYERQSLLYLPSGLPEPSAPGYLRSMLETSVPLIDASGGGAFLLFTSHRALEQATTLLRERWGGQVPYRLYVQGEAPRERLLREFRADGNGVLLGTASFWEGVDVKGPALRLIIIEKLPFGSPEEPVTKARIEHIQASGGSPFRDFQLPEAALALKQGIGRLIRSETDFGVAVICDRRIVERAYGRALLAALPPMRRTRDREEALSFLRAHAPHAATSERAPELDAAPERDPALEPPAALSTRS